MKRIGVLTSGGDAPGMNAAIRAVVRTGVAKGWEVWGVRGGYQGLITGKVLPLGARDVGGIMQRGGTILGSARAPEFKTEEGQLKALRTLNEQGIEALVVIGGNGSQTGTGALHKLGFPVVGVASTIDNDLYGSDTTIGVDTALNIALEAIDRLKTTASSLQRAFLLEVMGRDCGYLALMSAIAGGAEACLIPEVETDPEELASSLGQPTRKVKNTPLLLWRKVPSTMPKHWDSTSLHIVNGWDLTCVLPSSGTFNGAAHPAPMTVFWPPAWQPGLLKH